MPTPQTYTRTAGPVLAALALATAAVRLTAQAGPSPTAAGTAVPVVPVVRRAADDDATFRFSDEARDALRSLWQESVDAKEERVACIGGVVDPSGAAITRVHELTTSRADSFGVSAVASLRRCAPPNWLGTVHTHIARQDGQPYILFSGADRIIMQMWRSRWHADGVFCILYDDTHAHCEVGNMRGGYTDYVIPAIHTPASSDR
jgi:hypothetical protein